MKCVYRLQIQLSAITSPEKDGSYGDQIAQATDGPGHKFVFGSEKSKK